MSTLAEIEANLKPGETTFLVEHRVVFIECSASRDDGYPDRYTKTVVAESAETVGPIAVASEVKRVLNTK